MLEKKKRSVSKEDTNLFLYYKKKKKSDLHLRKIQISFYVRKKIQICI